MKTTKEQAREVLRDKAAVRVTDFYAVNVEVAIDALSTAGLLHRVPTEEEFMDAAIRASREHPAQHSERVSFQDGTKWAYRYLTGRDAKESAFPTEEEFEAELCNQYSHRLRYGVEDIVDQGDNWSFAMTELYHLGARDIFTRYLTGRDGERREYTTDAFCSVCKQMVNVMGWKVFVEGKRTTTKVSVVPHVCGGVMSDDKKRID